LQNIAGNYSELTVTYSSWTSLAEQEMPGTEFHTVSNFHLFMNTFCNVHFAVIGMWIVDNSQQVKCGIIPHLHSTIYLSAIFCIPQSAFYPLPYTFYPSVDRMILYPVFHMKSSNWGCMELSVYGQQIWFSQI